MRPPLVIIMDKKKILLIISSLLIIVGLTILSVVAITMSRDNGDNTLDPDDTAEYSEVDIDPVTAFLTEHNWIRVGNCEEHIVFTRNGGFSYWCSCGSPVDDYDLYDSFECNDFLITFTGGEEKSSARVIYYDEYYLCLYLEAEEECRVFVDESYAYADYVEHDPVSFVYDGWAELYILGYGENEITVAPIGYDGDAKKDFEPYIRNIKLRDDAEFYSVTTVDDKGEVTTEHTKLSEEDENFIGEYYTGGFVNFDAEGNVKYIVFYGKTTIM